MPNQSTFFLAVLLVSFVVQVSYYHTISLADDVKWVERVKNLSHDILQLPIHIDFKDNHDNFRYGGHPGTSILLQAAIAFRLGAHPQYSLLATIAFINALVIASIVLTCHTLRPYSSWWLIAGFIVTIHPLYFYGTPTNVVIGPTIALLFLLALLVYEKRSRPLYTRLAWFISFIIGLGLSTRLPDTTFIAVPLIVFMSAYISFQHLLLIVAASIFFAILFNPFFWFIPIEYIKTIILSTASHIVDTGSPGFQLTPLWVLYYTPLTTISIFLAVLSFICNRKKIPVSAPFLLTLFLITAATSSLFLSAKSQTLRYLYPLIFTWDILLPLFLLRLSDQIHFPFITNVRYLTLARQLTRLFIVSAIVFGFSFLAIYNLILPGFQGAI